MELAAACTGGGGQGGEDVLMEEKGQAQSRWLQLDRELTPVTHSGF